MVTETMNGVSSIKFSSRVHQLIEESMSKSIIIKLLGRRIGYSAFHNKLYALWKPSRHFRLMDLDNEYFLVRFQAIEDYTPVLARGPCVIFRKYLTVQPWRMGFDPSALLTEVMA